MDYILTAHNRYIMHGEKNISDNMIKVAYALISVDWRSADRSRYVAKRRYQVVLLFFFFVFFDEISL